MDRKFNYIVEKPEDIAEKIKEFSEQVQEEFRGKIYKVNRESFLSMADCYKSPAASNEEVGRCAQKSFERMSRYAEGMQSAWSLHMEAMGKCMEGCNQGDTVCYSNCYNDYLAKTYGEIKRFFNTFK
eukprot:TRINITY_DN5427_c0_g2_i19.p1 TRINITY_DN5427_c0_g2~~TRINITY_DN5427_c0_g2_i19.p1  ORF type:complete len:127 (-),score=45.82 TRINITY_DN5427_c0_g2_i19:177-557(-)